MPLYQYKDKNGNIVEKMVSIKDRDNQEGLTRLVNFTGRVWAPHSSSGYA